MVVESTRPAVRTTGTAVASEYKAPVAVADTAAKVAQDQFVGTDKASEAKPAAKPALVTQQFQFGPDNAEVSARLAQIRAKYPEADKVGLSNETTLELRPAGAKDWTGVTRVNLQYLQTGNQGFVLRELPPGAKFEYRLNVVPQAVSEKTNWMNPTPQFAVLDGSHGGPDERFVVDTGKTITAGSV